jgi:hypothetical protein
VDLQSQSGLFREEKILSLLPGFEPLTLQLVAYRYTDYALSPPLKIEER